MKDSSFLQLVTTAAAAAISQINWRATCLPIRSQSVANCEVCSQLNGQCFSLVCHPRIDTIATTQVEYPDDAVAASHEQQLSVVIERTAGADSRALGTAKCQRALYSKQHKSRYRLQFCKQQTRLSHMTQCSCTNAQHLALYKSWCVYYCILLSAFVGWYSESKNMHSLGSIKVSNIKKIAKKNSETLKNKVLLTLWHLTDLIKVVPHR